MNISVCPTPKELEGLLRGSLPSPAQSALTEHVGECNACQRALDDLAGAPSGDVLMRTELDRPASDSAYWPAVAALNQEMTQGDNKRSPRDVQAPVDFLSPSDDPAHLG